MISANEVHGALAGNGWAEALARLGVGDSHLRNRHGPCPICGGRDRFRFDNRHGRGDYFCGGCGPGDGFALLQKLHGWDFRETLNRVAAAAGLASDRPAPSPMASIPVEPAEPSRPSARVRDVLRGTASPDAVSDVIEYLSSRELWPLPPDCALRAHAGVEYWDDRVRVGKFPALVAPVRDVDGMLVTAHCTYLRAGRKLEGHAPRKILSAMTGRAGCAVRLVRLSGDTLGLAEGVETALAAHRLHRVPVWAALNASMLAKFTPPSDVQRLIVFADRDPAGQTAAKRLKAGSSVAVEVRFPPAPAKDWNDVLAGGAA